MGTPGFDKIIVVTKKTALEELIERFNTVDQARFYIERMSGSFADYQEAHDVYQEALKILQTALPVARTQVIERSFLPNFLFGRRNLVVTLGPDGLVINTAKYLDGQPLCAFNPDPQRIDGVLIPFPVQQASRVLKRVMGWDFDCSNITMAKATLNDGQTLYAVNDFFLGQRTHVSARYRIRYRDQQENQISSGIIISTGAGSTGWLKSIATGACGLVRGFSGNVCHPHDVEYRMDRTAAQLCFAVREPFFSKISTTDIVYGIVLKGENLEILSQMPQNGVIFSDGIENDYLQFNSGAIAKIEVADKNVTLVQ